MVIGHEKLLLTVVLTGPESSGKTTLAQALQRALNTSLVPEFSRPYLQNLGRKYEKADLFDIYSGQKCWQEWYALQCQQQVLICDTDWTVIRIWEQYQFGSKIVTNVEKPAPGTWYFLCAPDLPWISDPLRENPVDRHVLFALYHQLLLETNAQFSVLRGTHEQRLAAALAIISKIL